MKQVLYIFLCFAFLAGCKKAIQKTKEQVAEELIVTAMTDGKWTVTVYTDGTDYKPDFDPYEFQFKTNRTVDAINGGSVESNGTWQGDGYAMTISSNFSASSTITLQRLNGLWKIVDNTWTWVKATQTINGKLTTLELRKK
ncbi:MAG: hypothetical protein IPK31_21070 [Chitinophagaceae bacterium]|nr:hypothetical protein [Chitinophagaceae bacterium]